MERLIEMFKEGNPIKLTKEQEIEILRYVWEHEQFIGSGTTRAVFTFKDKYVVKIGISEEGVLQNEVERSFYKAHWGTGLFATLYATGMFVNIAERLVSNDECEDEDTFCEVVEALNDVTDYDGGDNEQIGWSKERECWVAYDYGYDSEHDHSALVGNMDEWSYVLEIPPLAVQGIKDDHIFTRDELREMMDDVRYYEEEEYYEDEEGEEDYE